MTGKGMFMQPMQTEASTAKNRGGVQRGFPESFRNPLPVPIAILGVPFDNVTTDETIEWIEKMVASRRPHYLVTANVDFLVQAQRDTELRRILCDAHLVVCDGTPLLWASRLLGNPLPERVAGADLVPLLIRVAAERGYRVFFLGASPEAAEQAVTNLRRQYPNLVIAGHYSPPFKPLLEMDHEEIKRRIDVAKPDLLFVGFGCPKQEKWMTMHYHSLKVPVMVGVGATIDFLAGRVKRAPVWMQRSGTEWIFRLAQEPRRLVGRYLTDLWVFGWKIIAQWWRMQSRPWRSGQNSRRMEIQSEAEWQEVRLPEVLDLATVQNHENLTTHILSNRVHYLVEMSQVRFMDSTGLGLLLRLQKKLREIHRCLVLVSPSAAVRNILALVHLEELFCIADNMEAAKQLIQAGPQAPLGPLVWTSAVGELRWQGEITAANAEEVWRKTMAHFTGDLHASCAIIDLSEVTFIDSSGLGVMLRARKLVHGQGRQLIFRGVPPVVRNVLRISRLEHYVLGEEPQNASVHESSLAISAG